MIVNEMPENKKIYSPKKYSGSKRSVIPETDDGFDSLIKKDKLVKIIKLGGKKGGRVLVSLEKFEMLNKYSWHKTNYGYASTRINGKSFLMHRFIMSEELAKESLPDLVVDHINNNKLDNRSENLRILTRQFNARNKKISKSNKSTIYKGVSLCKRSKKYCVKISYSNTYYRIGSFNNALDGAIAYDMYIIHNKLVNFSLNFPEDRKKYQKTEYISMKKNKKVKYIGVTKRYGKYRTNIIINHKCVYTFACDNGKKCAMMRDKYIVGKNIPGKKLNFPNKFPEYNPNTKIKTFCEEIDNDTVKLLISDNTKIVTISKSDYDKIKFFNCYFSNQSGYINIYINRKNNRLHRFLMDITDSLIYIDHIDNNKLNNTRNNLRLSNALKNAQNKTKMRNGTSKYLGVSYNKNRDSWQTKLAKDNKVIFCKTFSNKIDSTEVIAAVARDLYIINNLQDNYYPLNFSWTDKDIKYWTKRLNLL